MIKLIKRLSLVFFCNLVMCSLYAQPSKATPFRVLFVPLDDRPPCYQFTRQMALIGDVQLVAVPKELLGRFTTAGESDRIIKWINSQDLTLFDAAIISVDMLAYGGLVGSRVYNVKPDQALQRIQFLNALRKKNPKLKIYAQSVIMRLAPTADGKNEAYRADLSKWAEVSVQRDSQSVEETKKLAAVIPAEGLLDYKAARKRNLEVNLKAIDYVRSGVFDYLVLSQDDAKPVGIHVGDRMKLQSETKRSGLENRIAVQPGADEVSMLLLARALNNYHRIIPKVRAVYSSESVSNTVMPFEDKPLRETVSFHIRAAGALEVREEKEADLLFYVFASRKEAGRAKSFADEIEKKIREGKRVMIADIDPVGDVQGGDSVFTRELMKRKLFTEFNSYASWNTAANTIGTTLPQGLVFNVAEKKLLTNKEAASRIWSAQNWFMIHRVLDDFYFHGFNRLKVNAFFNQSKLSSKTLDDQQNKSVEAYGEKLMMGSLDEFTPLFFNKPARSRQQNINCEQPSGLTFKLPWNRTFEAEIDFVMHCKM